MKFLHAADIHLDSPLLGLQAQAGMPADLIRESTRRAFSAMIDLALAEDVAFVIIAGDLYDGDWRDFSTGLFFAAEMRRLGRPCFLLRGNHDARSVITKNLPPPPNLLEFSTRTCTTHRLDELGVALHGHSFPQREVLGDLSGGYPTPLPGFLNIGVLHTSADDPGDHATYAPCRVQDLVLKGYDYWALGHIHARRVLSEHPWVVFPGNLQGRHAKETGAKSCTLVTVEDRRIVAVEHRAVDVLRWAALEVDATGATMADITTRLERAVEAVLEEADGRPLLARLTLTGATDLHGRLLDDTENLAAMCQALAANVGGSLHVEAVRVLTRLPSATAPELLAPLQQAFQAGLGDPDLVSAVLAEFQALRQRIPDLDLPRDADGLALLAADAWSVVADALDQDAAP